MPPLYRSPNTPHGFFNDLGTVHIHIDGAHDATAIKNILQQLERQGHPGKFNHIIDSVAGPQRQLIPETYKSHTPGFEKEDFNFFSTTLLGHDQNNILTAIQVLLSALPSGPGVVVELEQIIGKIDQAKNQKEFLSAPPVSVDLTQIPCHRFFSLPIEIHHALDIPKQGPPPIALPQLLDEGRALGIIVGGWFLFEKESSWAYRSNSFAEIEDAQTIASKEHQLLRAYLDQQKHPYQLRTLIENVLGIWRI